MSRRGTKGGNQHTVNDRVNASLANRRKSHPSANTAFREFERRVPRGELLDALAGSADPRAVSLAALMTDIVLGKQTLPTLARRAGLSYVDVLQLLTSSRLQAGLLAMSAHVPGVLEDAAMDARSRMLPCATCKGTGKLATAPDLESPDATPVVAPCWYCDGSGKVRKAGDTDARKLVFETLGLTNKGRAMVNIDQRTMQVASVEDDLAAAGRVIDAPVPGRPDA